MRRLSNGPTGVPLDAGGEEENGGKLANRRGIERGEFEELSFGSPDPIGNNARLTADS